MNLNIALMIFLVVFVSSVTIIATTFSIQLPQVFFKTEDIALNTDSAFVEPTGGDPIDSPGFPY